MLLNDKNEIDMLNTKAKERNVYEYSFNEVTIPYSIKVNSGNVIVDEKNRTITTMDSSDIQILLTTEFGNVHVNSENMIYLSQEKFEAEKKADEIVGELITEQTRARTII